MRARARLLATSAVLATVVLSGTALGGNAQRLPALAPAAPDGLTRALARGEVSEAVYALERARTLFAPGTVARRFGGLQPIDPHGATVLLRDLAVRLGELDPAQRAAAEAILSRPDDDGDGDPGDLKYSVAPAAPLCTEHVCVHWVPTSRDAPPAVDTDANGVPDQVDATLRVLEEVWQKEVVEYGYRPPKPDGGSPNHGPDERIDVYLADLGDEGTYGFCATDDPTAAQSPDGPWDVSAYCALDNDFDPAQFPGPAGDAALQVTAAHEFFHAIQFAYDFLEDTWAVEGTAVWMEDEVYDDVNDSYQYLDKSPLRQPRIPLDLAIDGGGPLGGFQYGSFVFWRFLSESFGGPEVIKRVWEHADGSPAGRDEYSLQAVDSALRERGSRARAAFARFGAVNAHPSSFYEEGSSYPAAPIALRRTLSPRRPNAAGAPRLDHLTTWYGAFRPGPAAGPEARFRLTLDLPARTRGAEATVIVVPRDGDPRLVPIALDARGDARRTVPFAPADVKEIQLVLSNASGRYRCWERMPLACGGTPRDDGQLFRYEAELVGG